MKFSGLSEAKRGWARLVIKLVIGIAFIYLVFGVFSGIWRVDGIAMDGRIKDGDFVLFDRLSSNYSAGDIIVFTKDNGIHVSEIIATEDDLVSIDEDGFLFINGIKFREESVYDKNIDESLKVSQKYRVPKDSFYILNENLSDEYDSRTFGAISRKDIKGKIIGLLLRTINI